MDLPAHLSEAFAEEELREHKEVFDSFDGDGSGEIDAEELAALSTKLGNPMSIKEAQQQIADIDLDGNGLVNFVEYLTMMLDQQTLAKKKVKKSSAINAFARIAETQAQRARERKAARLKEEEEARQAKEAERERVRAEAALRASQIAPAKALEIAQRNEEKQLAAAIALAEVERQKEEEIRARAEAVHAKAVKGAVLAREAEEKVWREAQQKAEASAKKARKSQIVKEKLLIQQERERVEAEKEREKRRAAAARRAEIERLFTPKDLASLRQQFDDFDEDGSGSIDAEELGAICASLGETLNAKQLEALIKEVDTDGNGTVEWEEYLMAMYRKRQDARAKGSGLLEIFSQRKREAELKKEALLMEKQAAAEARLMSTEQDIALANARAAEAVVQRQVEIAQRNEEKQLAAAIALQEVERQKEEEIRARAEAVHAKAVKGAVLAREAEEKVWREAQQKAEASAKKARKSQIVKEKLLIQQERERVEAEKEREKRRAAAARRAEIERLFTPKDLASLRQQFDDFDEDGSGSIDAEELGAICASLGETLNAKQLEALIKEVDTDGNGTVEWEEYLMAMYRKRQDARAKGSGLLEIFSQRKREAELKKEALLMEKQAAAEARLMSTEQDIALANARAAEAVVQRQVEIAQRNEEKQLAAAIALQEVERQKDEEIRARAEAVHAKAAKGAVLAREAEEKVWREAQQKAKASAKKARLSIASKQRQLEEDELRREAVEMEREKRRAAAVKRAEVERLFTPKDLSALREQFARFDTAGTGSIGVDELGPICESLGANLSRKELQAFIREVDTDGSGTVEWEEYLGAMHRQRRDARAKGSGLLELFSKRKAEGELRKQEQILEQQRRAELRLQETERAAELANIRANKKKEKEQQAILRRNAEMERKAMLEKERIEREKVAAERKREAAVAKKAAAAQKRQKEMEKSKEKLKMSKAQQRLQKQKLADERRALKERFEDERRALKAKMLKAKSERKHNQLKLLKEKEVEMAKRHAAEMKNVMGPQPPARGSQSSRSSKRGPAPSPGRKIV